MGLTDITANMTTIEYAMTVFGLSMVVIWFSGAAIVGIWLLFFDRS